MARAIDSIPGDADCDGFVTRVDVAHSVEEIFDGDGSESGAVSEGGLFSCGGIDANEDGRTTAADLTTTVGLRVGQGTAMVASGPVVTYIGVAAASGAFTDPAFGAPLPVYPRPAGLGFHLVVEAAPGPSGAPVGTRLEVANLQNRPDFQIVFVRNLGNGSVAVCDDGGVPGVSPPSFGADETVSFALNDAACRFGAVSNPALACTADSYGIHRFGAPESTVQFCLPVSGREAFPEGTTLVTARVLDIDGRAGVPAQILVHVGGGPPPTLQPTDTPTNTPKPRPTSTATATPSRTRTQTPTAKATMTRTASQSPTPSRTATPSSTLTPTDTPPLTPHTRTATRTGVSTPTRTRTRTPSTPTTGTPTMTRVATETRTGTGTVTSTPTRTMTGLPMRTGTPTTSGTPTRTLIRTPTRTATVTRTSTMTRQPTLTPTPSATATNTWTKVPTRTRTGTLQPEATPTPTEERSPTATASRTVTRVPTVTLTRTASATRTMTRVPTPTRTGSQEPESTPTRTLRPSSTSTATLTRTATPTVSHTRIPTRTVTNTATRTVTWTATRSATLTPTRTATHTVTGTPTRSPTWTGTPTLTPTATPTRTVTNTRTPTNTPLPTATPTETQTRTETRTPTVTLTPTATRTGTATRTATRTLSPTSTRTITRTETPTQTPSITPTPSLTPTVTLTATPSLTPTITETPTVTATPTETLTPTLTHTHTVTSTPTQTRTPTATPRPAPDMTFFGIARPDDLLAQPSGYTSTGVPIYERPFGYGFTLVAEGKPGPSRRAVGMRSFRWDPGDPTVRPDIEIIVSNPLGDGSTAVCDNIPPFIGGVPASSGFEITQAISDAINDLGCRFVDGAGNPSGRSPGEACTRFPDGEFRVVGAGTTVQYCAPVVEFFSFPPGDTLVTVRLRDIAGDSSAPLQLIVRVMP